MHIPTSLDNLIWQAKRNGESKVGNWYACWNWDNKTGFVGHNHHGVVLEVDEFVSKVTGLYAHGFFRCYPAQRFPKQIRRIENGRV